MFQIQKLMRNRFPEEYFIYFTNFFDVGFRMSDAEKKEIFKNWTLPRNCRYWLIEHLMLHLFTLKSNSSFVNAQHNHKTVWPVWQIHLYRQYFKIFNFQRKILNLEWDARNASESPIFIFLPIFWRILNFRDTSCLNFFSCLYLKKRPFLSWADIFILENSLLMLKYGIPKFTRNSRPNDLIFFLQSPLFVSDHKRCSN